MILPLEHKITKENTFLCFRVSVAYH